MKWILVEEELDALYALATGGQKIKDRNALTSLKMKGLAVDEEESDGAISVLGEIVLDILQGETVDFEHQLEVSLVEEPLRFMSLKPKKPEPRKIEDFF